MISEGDLVIKSYCEFTKNIVFRVVEQRRDVVDVIYRGRKQTFWINLSRIYAFLV